MLLREVVVQGHSRPLLVEGLSLPDVEVVDDSERIPLLLREPAAGGRFQLVELLCELLEAQHFLYVLAFYFFERADTTGHLLIDALFMPFKSGQHLGFLGIDGARYLGENGAGLPADFVFEGVDPFGQDYLDLLDGDELAHIVAVLLDKPVEQVLAAAELGCHFAHATCVTICL